MSIIDTFKENHIREESERFDDALNGIKYLLNYKSKYEDEKLVQELTEKILCLRDVSKYAMFGSLNNNLSGYNIGFTPIRQMEELRHFISHEIIDDGDPGIGYYKQENRLSLVEIPCLKEDRGARPYFHRSFEKLLKFDPKAEYCSIENALKVVQFYIDEEARTIKRNKRYNKKYNLAPSDIDDFFPESFDEEQLQFVQLCKELKEK